MIYLDASEVATYCTMPIEQTVLTQANLIVESYIGDIGQQQKVNERIVLNRSNRSKLSKIKDNVPLISVDEVTAQTRTPFGISNEAIDVSNVVVDNYGYLTYYPGSSMMQQMFGGTTKEILVTYTYGWSTIPSDIKFATGVIAQNIAKRGTFGNKSIVDFDVQLQFLDDSVVTSDVRLVLQKYRGV